MPRGLADRPRTLARPSGATGPPRRDADRAPGPTLVLHETSVATPSHQQFLEGLGVAAYTTDADGRITFSNQAAVELWGRAPAAGEMWSGFLKLFWPNGEPMGDGECPMAIALKEERSVRGYEGLAERPDGTRVAFETYPTVVTDERGEVIGAINVLIDVSARRRAEDGLRVAIAVKDEFLGLVSHELRTPVTTILGNANLLAARKDVGEPLRSLLGDLGSEAERLAGVVENLLVLTRAGAPIDMHREPQILDRVVRGAVAQFGRRQPGREVRLTGDFGGRIVDADRAYLELLFANLLGNANKYSPPGEPIDVQLDGLDASVEVRVLDRGIGFAPDEAGNLFTAFYRSEAAKRMASGLGIGLSACRLLVELLGGRIWAAPRQGGGSEFGFSLSSAVITPE
ncbi:MAG: ATP-binding protein [Chloroflexota bacterium]